jgi:predicted dehydrogenase
MQPTQATSRRQFLRRSAAATAGVLAAPYFVRASALGLAGGVAASERIVMGAIGTGGMGKGDMNAMMGFPEVQMVAVCDVDSNHRKQAREMVNKKYGNSDCKDFNDFRELLAIKDIDAVTVTTPDHWHALASVAAANAGKDVYCEKPLANSVAEGRAICEAVKKNQRILQTGSHERSGGNARFACELVRNGRLGKVHTVQINLPCDDDHHNKARAVDGVPSETAVPEGFDYDFWLGHTPQAPYTPKRCHFWWRFNLAYGGGEMTDRGAHVIDIAQLGLGMDDTGPVEFEATGVRKKDSLYNVFWDYTFTNTYANGVRMVGTTKGPRGLKFIGEKGWIFVEIHGGRLEAEPASLLQEKISDGEIQLGRSPGHQRNFIDSVKSRQQPVAHAEIGHRTGSICHLNNIAMLVGRKLKWDPAKEQFVGDDEANKLLAPSMRSPWSLG